MDRTYAIPSEASGYHLFDGDSHIKSHSSYLAGKAGDTDAALALIEDVAKNTERCEVRITIRKGGNRG